MHTLLGTVITAQKRGAPAGLSLMQESNGGQKERLPESLPFDEALGNQALPVVAWMGVSTRKVFPCRAISEVSMNNVHELRFPKAI